MWHVVIVVVVALACLLCVEGLLFLLLPPATHRGLWLAGWPPWQWGRDGVAVGSSFSALPNMAVATSLASRSVSLSCPISVYACPLLSNNEFFLGLRDDVVRGELHPFLHRTVPARSPLPVLVVNLLFGARTFALLY